jgi:hypothetical protein
MCPQKIGIGVVDKAPDPMASRAVFTECCDIIKSDIHATFHQLYHLDAGALREINSSLIVLIPKKDGADPCMTSV